MWSKPLLCRFRQPGEIQQTQVSQGFAAFRLALSRIRPRRSQTRRDTNFAIPGYSISAMIPRQGVKIKIFLSVVIPVVKTVFVPFSATREKPANAGAARLCGVSPHPIPDTTTALPNVAPYQLSYTRTFNFRHYTTAGEKIKDFSVCGHSCGQSRFCTAFSNRRKSCKCRCCKALRRFDLPYPGYRHGTPEPRISCFLCILPKNRPQISAVLTAQIALRVPL